MKKPASIDAYLAAITDGRRKTLERLRATIHSVLPKVEECISYNMPAFRLDGVVIAGFLTRNGGCSYYPFSGSTLKTLAREVRGYGGTKGALHFEKPLPVALVRKLLRARIAEE